MPKSKGLTPKEKLFCRYYVVSFNGVQAMKKAGYKQTYKSLRVSVGRLLAKPCIAEAIDKIVEERNRVCNVDAKWVVDRLKQVAYADFSKFMEMGKEGCTKDELEKIPKYIRTMIQSVQIHEKPARYARDGECIEEASKVFKFTLMSKDKAMKLLGKHTGAVKDTFESTSTNIHYHGSISDMMDALDDETD